MDRVALTGIDTDQRSWKRCSCWGACGIAVFRRRQIPSTVRDPVLRCSMNIHILTVVLGGLFGWAIGKLPDKYVFVILAAAICYALVTFLA